MKKIILLKMEFNDDFCPPDKFEEATRQNHYKSACKPCPFWHWEDDTAYNDCVVGGYNECPIKRFF